MSRIIIKSQQDVIALYYEAQSWLAHYEGNLIPEPDEKPRNIRLTDFTPSWARQNLTLDEMLDWLDNNLEDWLVVAEWRPDASVSLSKVYALLLSKRS